MMHQMKLTKLEKQVHFHSFIGTLYDSYILHILYTMYILYSTVYSIYTRTTTECATSVQQKLNNKKKRDLKKMDKKKFQN